MILAFILISPIGFYFGVMDPYVSHCVYSGNAAIAKIRSVDGSEVGVSAGALNVVMPPTPRLFKLYFEQVAHPGDVLIIEEKSLWQRLGGIGGRTTTILRFPDGIETNTGARIDATHSAQ